MVLFWDKLNMYVYTIHVFYFSFFFYCLMNYGKTKNNARKSATKNHSKKSVHFVIKKYIYT